MSDVLGIIESIPIKLPRQIGTIVPMVVFRENHKDDLANTDHPVETGAAITDHAFKQPASRKTSPMAVHRSRHSILHTNRMLRNRRWQESAALSWLD